MENMAWSNPQAWLLRAAVAWVRGKVAEALDWLTRAEAAFQSADMALYAAVARRRRGQLLGDDQGNDILASADAWMTAQGIRNHARFAAMYAPGLGE